jgi:hypothetical protein
MEASSRASELAATNLFEEREICQALLEETDGDHIARWVLCNSDDAQIGYAHSDGDPFKLDTMNRLIEMLPPTLDGPRMAPAHLAYMMSTLVTNLNMHAWTHTSSCFKVSRATRYGFPRPLSEVSVIAGPTMILKRARFHEFINGYNPTIMAAFKCNYDIQVLFGGKNAINRIYYCCKYVNDRLTARRRVH